MKVYYSGPLFSAAEKAFNTDLTAKIEAIGLSVYLPQRDGPEHNAALYSKLSEDEKKESIFAVERMMVLKCDVFLFILDGRVPDEGACVELGMAFAQKYLTQNDKLLIGLHTDPRGAFAGARVNPMINQALDRVFGTTGELLEFLSGFRNGS